jgi:hypothetical protein
MATFVGSGGTVLVGSDVVGEIRSWSVDETMDPIESSTIGDSYRTFEVGMKGWTGSMEVYFDDTDTAQQAMTVDSSITVSFQMEGNTTGDHKLSGTALVTGRSVTASFDGMTEATLTVQGTGALTEGTVA